jgi:hypothetical protein
VTLLGTSPLTVRLPPPPSQERVRAQELAMRERETQELLKMGTLSSAEKKKRVSKGVWGGMGSKALAQNVAAEKVEMYGQAFKRIQVRSFVWCCGSSPAERPPSSASRAVQRRGFACVGVPASTRLCVVC